MTDFERADALDHLSSDELEAQAFGPDPDARRSLRGLVDRPATGAVTVRVKDPAKTRRWPRVVLGAAALALAFTAGVTIGVETERTSASGDVIEAVDGPAPPGEIVDPAVLEADAAALAAEAEALEAAVEAEAAALEAALEAEFGD